MKDVKITTESIRVDQFLKWTGIAATGGRAKEMIISGLVKVNGEEETRRSRQIAPGDTVEVEGHGCFRVVSGKVRGGT